LSFFAAVAQLIGNLVNVELPKRKAFLKVVCNEKGGGSGIKLLLEYGFGPWQSMAV
jgi:hypothetical protein